MIIQKERSYEVYQAAWWLVAVTVPWAITFNNIALIVLIIIWLLDGHFTEKWKALKKATWAFPFFLFYGAYLVGLIYSDDTSSGLNNVIRKIPILALPLIVSTGPTLKESFVDRLKVSFAYSCFALVIVSITIATFLLFKNGPQTENLGTNAEHHYQSLHLNASSIWLHFSYIQIGRWGDLHPSYLSTFLLFSVFILLNVKNEKHRVIKTISIIVMIIFIGLLASRMAILAFVIASGYWILMSLKRKAKTTAIYFSLSIALLTASVWLNPVALFRVVEEPLTTPLTVNKKTIEWNSVNYRLLEWNGAWSVISKNHVLGIGTGDANQALKNFYSNYNASTASLDYNAHNQYLQTWMEVGLVGLIPFLLCLFLPWLPSLNKAENISFTIIFSLMCLTESMLERQKGIIFFSLFFSLLLCAKKSDR